MSHPFSKSLYLSKDYGEGTIAGLFYYKNESENVLSKYGGRLVRCLVNDDVFCVRQG